LQNQIVKKALAGNNLAKVVIKPPEFLDCATNLGQADLIVHLQDLNQFFNGVGPFRALDFGVEAIIAAIDLDEVSSPSRSH
jgi:hypothetical protein